MSDLDASQRAMVAARIKGIFEAGKVHGRGQKVEEKLPQPTRSAQSRDLAGAAVGVSGRSVDMATKVIAAGAPELVAAVDAGKIACAAVRGAA